MSARCITVMYHSPNRWGESHKTVVTLIKARFLTSIVGNQAKCCDDVPSAVLQPPEILKASALRVISLTCIRCSTLIMQCSACQCDHPIARLIAIVIPLSKKKQLIDGLSKQNLTTKQY